MQILHLTLKKYRRYYGIAFIIVLGLIAFIPIRMAIAYYLAPSPEAILTLGGGLEREEFTAQFARRHPSLEIWVSSGTESNQARRAFRNAGIPDEKVHLDRQATDTITNFTSLVEDFKHRDLQHVYLVTSDFHMPRAKAIAFLVLGSQGIVFTPVSVPSDEPPELWLHICRDFGRALLWILTGRTGASLGRFGLLL